MSTIPQHGIYGPPQPPAPDPPTSADRLAPEERRSEKQEIGQRIREWAPVGTFLVVLLSALGTGGCYLTDIVTDRLDEIGLQIERVEAHVDEQIDRIEDSIGERLDELEDSIDEQIDEFMQRLVRVETTVENSRAEGQRQDGGSAPPEDETQAP